MRVDTGRFENPGLHHKGRYRLFRFGNAIELWFNERWIMIDLNRK
jgi:hypothetical protein